MAFVFLPYDLQIRQLIFLKYLPSLLDKYIN